MISTLSRRARMTEGQLYSSLITLTVAVALLFGLGDLHGVVSTTVASQPLPLSPQQPAPVVVPTPTASGPVALPELPQPPITSGQLPEPLPQTAPLPSYDGSGPVPSEPVPTTSPSPRPTEDPCQLAVVNDTALQALKTVAEASGGKVPTSDLAAAVGIVTGCDPADPAVVLVGLLIGIGRALPDPGLPNPVVLPFVTIPAPVVAALQPARPAIDAACGLVGTGQTVASLFISAYPQPVPQVTSQVLFTALSVCGQVRTP